MNPLVENIEVLYHCDKLVLISIYAMWLRFRDDLFKHYYRNNKRGEKTKTTTHIATISCPL
jgi:hypothetical protein